MKACCDLVEGTGAKIVGVACLIELAGLNGRDKLRKYDVHTVLTY
jgi:adenine phosphoribosyltransferase